MSDPALSAQVAAANAYEDLFVPALFAQWPSRVLAAARVESGQRVLDVACGTGVLARAAAARVGPRGSVAGLDANPGMLTVARQLAPELEWREGTAESLPFPEGGFDRVVSQFGLMFFSDRLKALEEMGRVLAPGGRVAVAVWDSLDHTPVYTREVEILEREAGPRAADALRAPFVLGDRRTLEPLFADAGFGSVQVSTQSGVARFPSLRSLLTADLRGWLPLMGVHLSDDVVERILSLAEKDLAPWVAADGSFTFEVPAHIVSATQR